MAAQRAREAAISRDKSHCEAKAASGVEAFIVNKAKNAINLIMRTVRHSRGA